MNDLPPTFDSHVMLGQLDGRLSALETRLGAMEPMVRETHDAIVTARGERKSVLTILALTGSLGGMIGAFGHWLLTHK